MISYRIKALRESHDLTQINLAARLGITRSSVNSWEMGLTIPSTVHIVRLARIFNVSTDYLLGLNYEMALDISGLDADSVRILNDMLHYMKSRQK